MRAVCRAKFISVVVAIAVLPLTVTSRPASADWPQCGRALSTASGNQLSPAIASDGAGGAIVTWHDRRRFPFNIEAQHVLASGQVDAAWPTDGRALLTEALAQSIVPQGKEFPAIVSDGAGGAIVTWPDGRSSLNGLDIYAHHVLASGAVDAAWPVNGTTVCSVTGEQISPVIISDGARGAFVAWTDGRSGTTVNDLDVFTQHVLASGLADPCWPANGTPVCTAPKAQVLGAIVGDGAGGVIVTWSDSRSGNPGSDIYAQHVFGSGAVDPAWPINGLALSAAPGTQSAPRIISDGAPAGGGSGAIVTWTDTRDGTNQIFAQRVLNSSAIAPGWPTDGRAVSIGGIDEVLPTLASDGASGAIVAWGGGRSGHHNMRAQHVLASGVLDAAWPVGGTSLSFAPSEETSQVMVSDGAGGAIVTWQVSQDIEAQHVLASGALDPAYPANGRVLCALPSAQHEPDIVATGAGGAIVTWMDRRDGFDDIYALQVLEAGTTDVSPGTGRREIAFARPSPNPAHGAVTLRFALPRAAHVMLAIYDAAGRRVRQIASGEQAIGEHPHAWDLRDEAGRTVGAGLYFARLEVEGRVLTQKIATLK